VTVLIMAVAAWSQPTLEIEPRLISLGSFSALSPAENAPNPGTTTIHIHSDVPWSLQATLIQPMRRVSDNLELPLERVRQYFPDLAQLCNYVAVQMDYGPGGSDTQVLEFDWQLAQARIAQYLDSADPPGTYRFSVRIELTDRTNEGLAVPINLVVEFTILPYVALSLPNPNITVQVEELGQAAESDVYYVTVKSNTAWVLDMQMGSGPAHVKGPYQLDGNQVMWQVGSGDDWETYLPMYIPVGAGTAVAARGSAPPPLTLSEAVIPFQLKVQTDRITIAGTYSADIKFGVHADDPAR
jgi:hypothetical protein